jgi:replication factor A1
VELDQTVDLGGVIRSADPKRTFDRDDGSEGQVRNIRIQDQTDDIRVALWGEKADKDLQPGDEVFVADAEIQDGWQDDLEASAGWGSTVVVLDDSASLSGTGDAAETDRPAEEAAATSGGGSGASLSSFAGDDGGGSTATASGGDTTAQTTDDADAEQIEFTGTVVQTGNPVVIDDGEQTMSVDTTATVELGQEVTARGTLHDGRLDADDVF